MHMALLPLAAVAPLPRPPAFAHYLFENPVPAALGLLAAAVVVRLALTRQNRERAGRAVGWALIAAAAGTYITGELVNTPREQVRFATRRLVEAAATGQTGELEARLADQVTLAIGSLESTSSPRPDVLALVRLLQERVPIRDVSIGEIQAHAPQADRAITQVWARVDPRDWFPTPTVWRIDWRKDAAGDWRATGIRAVLINGRSPGAEVSDFVFRGL